MRNRFKRDIQSIPDVFDFTESFIQQYQLGSGTAFSLDLILEEIFSNIIKYNKEGKSDILIELRLNKNIMIIKIIDECSSPFDFSAIDNYDRSASLEKRPIGKLGLHFIKILADHISFNYRSGFNTITIMKNLEEPHV